MPGRKITDENRINGGKKSKGATKARTLEMHRKIRNKLLDSASKNEIRDMLHDEYNIGHGASDKHIAAVWDEILADEKEQTHDKRSRAVARIRRLVRKGHNQQDISAALRGEKLLAEIEGTLQPRKLELAGPGGQPLLDPEFRSLLDVVLRSLEKHPAARADVGKAVEKFLPPLPKKDG